MKQRRNQWGFIPILIAALCLGIGACSIDLYDSIDYSRTTVTISIYDEEGGPMGGLGVFMRPTPSYNQNENPAGITDEDGVVVLKDMAVSSSEHGPFPYDIFVDYLTADCCFTLGKTGVYLSEGGTSFTLRIPDDLEAITGSMVVEDGAVVSSCSCSPSG